MQNRPVPAGLVLGDLSAYCSLEDQQHREGPRCAEEGAVNEADGLGMQRPLLLAGAWGWGCLLSQGLASCAPRKCGRCGCAM